VDISTGDASKTFSRIKHKIGAILHEKVKPITIGGDHSVTIPVLEAINEYTKVEIGVIHFDAHLDNIDNYGGDKYARCCPIARITELSNIKPENIVQIGVRGPRNTYEGLKFAKDSGATVFNIFDIRERGMDEIITEAINIASNNTDSIYYTFCGDALDPAYTYGVAPDPMGLTSYEVLKSVLEIGRAGICGFDVVEFYPDPKSLAFHTACWIILYTLAGMVKY
jgi:agmatinase